MGWGAKGPQRSVLRDPPPHPCDGGGGEPVPGEKTVWGLPSPGRGWGQLTWKSSTWTQTIPPFGGGIFDPVVAPHRAPCRYTHNHSGQTQGR